MNVLPSNFLEKFESELLSNLCDKCRGSGRFVSSAGRDVGPCFACNGQGMKPQKPQALAADADACDKCRGSGRFVSSAGRDVGQCFACKGSGRKNSKITAIGQDAVDRLRNALETAVKNKAPGGRKPRLRFEGFIASLAPAAGKNPGSVYCKSRAGVYLGKIADGAFVRAYDCDEPSYKAIIAAMADPLAAAVAYGKQTGECSCCGRELTNEESISLGIGPICRSKFGL